MFVVAVVLYVLERTGSASLAGATVAAATLPSLVTGPVLGSWFDRARRRSLVIASDQAVAIVTLAALLVVPGRAPDWVVLVVAVVSGTTLPLSKGGFTSLIPSLVPDDLLTRANAVEAASFNLATVGGPAIAAAIAAAWTPGGAIAVEIGLYLVALPLVIGVSEPPRRLPDPTPVAAAVAQGIRHVVRTPALLGVTVAGSIALLGRGLLVIAFPLFAAQSLDASQSAGGYLWAAFALGAMAGALGLVRIQASQSPATVVLLATGGSAALVLLWPLAGSLAVAVLLVAAAGFAYGPGLAATFTVRQMTTPMDLRGQVFMTAASLKTASFAAGSALAGLVADALGVSGALVACGLAQLSGALVGWVLIRERSA
jgi:predicted MFS family arabinose efflux permease